MRKLAEIAETVTFGFSKVSQGANLFSREPVINHDCAAALLAIARHHSDKFVLARGGRLYVSDGKQATKPVAFVNPALPAYRANYYPDCPPALDAALGKCYVEALTESFLFLASCADPEAYRVTFRADIVAQYQRGGRDGVTSCMTHHVDDYDTDGVHPCAIYERELARRIRLAVMEYRDTGKVIARALCDMESGNVSRLYYPASAPYEIPGIFSELVSRAGFSANDSPLAGCKFPVQYLPNRWGKIDKTRALFAFLDRGYLWLDPAGEILQITAGSAPPDIGWSEVYAGNTNGVCEIVEHARCECCGSNFPIDDLRRVYGGEFVCEDCQGDHYVYSDHVSDYIYGENAVYSSHYSDHIPSEDSVYSDTLEDYLIESESVEVEFTYNGGSEISDYFPQDMDITECFERLAAAYCGRAARRRRYG